MAAKGLLNHSEGVSHAALCAGQSRACERCLALSQPEPPALA